MLYGSRISKKKVFHYGDCSYSKRISTKNRLYFATTLEARSQGYTQCPCCNRIPMEYRKNMMQITDFCDEHDLWPILKDDELFVISKDDTAWRIRMKGDGSKGKQLLHESKLHVKYDRKKTRYENRKYHIQEIPSSNIIGYLCYIYKHDTNEAFRMEKEKKAKSKISEQVKNIQAVQKQISRQKRKHSKHEPAESNAQKRRRSNQFLRDITKAFSDYRAAAEAYI